MYDGWGLGSLAPSIVFVNRTNAARTFSPLVGDQWTLTITGPANSAAVVTGGQNGVNATMQMGSTDASGRLVLDGAMTTDQIGDWYEDWSVGGVHLGVLQFKVSAAPGAPPLTPGGQAAIPPAPEVALGPAYQSAAAAAPEIPAGVYLVAGVVLLLVVFGGGGRR